MVVDLKTLILGLDKYDETFPEGIFDRIIKEHKEQEENKRQSEEHSRGLEELEEEKMHTQKLEEEELNHR